MPKLILAATLLLTACSAQKTFQTVKSMECEQYNKSAVTCAGSHSDDWRKLQQEQNQPK